MDAESVTRRRTRPDEPCDELARVRSYATDRSPLPLLATEGPDHSICYVNPAFCRLVGRVRDDMVGRPFADVVPLGKDSARLQLLDSVYLTGVSAGLSDQNCGDGQAPGARWSYAAWALFGKGERPTGVMLQVTDTTDAYRASVFASEVNQALVLTEVRQHEAAAAAEERTQRLRQAMRETDHRVKNHLQVIAGLLDMQLTGTSDSVPIPALRQVRTHIRTLAAIHGMLTEGGQGDSTTDTIPVRAALQELLAMWEQMLGVQRVRWTAEDVILPVKQVVSLALITNELVNNAIKHGGSSVEVTLKVLGGIAELEVSDDGPGFPASFSPATHANFGLELIESVTRTDLRGAAEYTNRPGAGARVLITFPIPAPSSIDPVHA